MTDQPPEWVTFYYDPHIPANVKTPAALAWHKLCWYLLPQDGRMAGLIYEGSKRRFLVRKQDGSAHFAALDGLGPDDRYATALGMSLASEFGDRDLYPQLRKWADTHYQPTFDDEGGEFYYRFGLEEPYPRGQYNGAIMPGFVGGAGAWWRLFNKPNLQKFIQPTVYDVDYTRLGISQAFYDAENRALLVSTVAHDRTMQGADTTFKVRNLGAGNGVTVYADGRPYTQWRLVGHALEIATTIDTHTFVIRETS